MTQDEANKAYRARNNSGSGWAPEGETVEAVVSRLEADGWTVELRGETTDDVAVLTSDGETLLIGGDAIGGGAWAVNL